MISSDSSEKVSLEDDAVKDKAIEVDSLKSLDKSEAGDDIGDTAWTNLFTRNTFVLFACKLGSFVCHIFNH